MKSLLLGVCFLTAAGPIPTFEQFKVADKFTGKPADPVMRTRGHFAFRNAISRAEEQGPNFAGHYSIAQWGCGAGCVSIALVDSETGRVLEGPFGELVYDLAKVYEGGGEQLEFRVDSRLMVARGCPGEKACGTYYYEWTDDHFKLIRKVRAARKL